MSDQLRRAALWYAQHGWAVLPCEPNGKAPLTKLVPNGCKDATTDAETIHRWWTAYPDANVGIACEPSKLVVADVDTKDGMPGLESWRDLEAAHGASIADTLTVTTPSKGMHVYWTRNGHQVANFDEKKSPLGLGVGVRANGEYVVAPPSRTPVGEYMWDADAAPHERKLATLPAPLARLLAPATKPEPQPIPKRDARETLAELRKATAALARLDPKLADDYDTWRDVGMALSELGPGGLAVWEAWSAQSAKWEPGECAKKWASFTPADGITLGTLYHLAKEAEPTAQRRRAEGHTMADLLASEFPEPVWVVPDLLPEGLAILGGRPKQGKSFLGQQLAVAFATGGVFLGRPVPQGAVLYLAMEDNPRRLQKRMRAMRAPASAPVYWEYTWPSMDAEGLDLLDQRILAEGYRLVVVDTLARSMGQRAIDWDNVGAVTRVLGPLQELALARGVSVLVIDHHRKPGMVTDVVDDVMSSTGKTATADTIWGLYRKRGDRGARLAVTGRDVDDCELGIRFDGLTLTWQLDETAEGVRYGTNQAAIMDALEEMGGEATTSELATKLDMDVGNVSHELAELVGKGVVLKADKRSREQPYRLAMFVPDKGHKGHKDNKRQGDVCNVCDVCTDDADATWANEADALAGF